jgi:colanic acid biosynthesis glycosyl transferase WcaI
MKYFESWTISSTVGKSQQRIDKSRQGRQIEHARVNSRVAHLFEHSVVPDGTFHFPRIEVPPLETVGYSPSSLPGLIAIAATIATSKTFSKRGVALPRSRFGLLDPGRERLCSSRLEYYFNHTSPTLTSRLSKSSNHPMDSNLAPATQPQRVWLVNLFFGPGLAPTGVLLESLAIDLQTRGWLVEILTGTADYRSDQQYEPSSFQGIVNRFSCHSKVSGLRGKLWSWIWFSIKVAWFTLWRRMPDIVIVQTTPPFLHTIFALRRLISWRHCAVILWNQDTFPEALVATGTFRPTSLTYRCLKWIASWSGRRITQAVALDGAMANVLSGQGIQNIRVIPNWDAAQENSASPTAMSARPSQAAAEPAGATCHPSQIPAELTAMAAGYRYIFAYTGNLGVGHDLAPLWDFIARHPRQTNFLFLFVGEGDRTRELKETVERNRWDCVKFWPYLPAVQFKELLNWTDVGLVALELNCLGLMSPSKMHAWLGAGKPVLYFGPEGSNVTETVRAFDCGFIVDPRDLQGFDTVAAQFLISGFELDEAGCRAKQAWKSRHSPEVGLGAWRDLLSKI